MERCSRQCARSHVLDASIVAESYRHRALLLDELTAKGTREELRTVIQRVIDVVEWKQDPENSKAGSAKIRLFPLAAPLGVKRGGSGSTTCPEWLPSPGRSRTKPWRLVLECAWDVSYPTRRRGRMALSEPASSFSADRSSKAC